MPRPHDPRSRHLRTLALLLAVALPLGLFSQGASARPEFRDAFYTVYPGTVGTPVETVPSEENHCGMCHWKFTGGGQRNPYGVEVEDALGSFPDDPNGYMDAIMSIESLDSDGDGYSTYVELVDTINYTNTPTFPGLTPANVGDTSRVDLPEIQDYLVPATGSDTTPPDVVLITPDGGEVLIANSGTTVEWVAGDASGISGINLWLSEATGEPYELVAFGLPNTGTYTWFPANRPTTDALFLVEAIDNAFNVGQDESDAPFTIQSPPGGIVPTTLRDFDQPGTQPHDSGILNPPEACAGCHGGYDAAVEPYANWRGSMMAQASRDLLFEANMSIANQDAPDSGDLCLRCHLPRGWLQGRSVPTDGSQMLPTDESGVACDLCHRLVDPIPAPENPAEDTAILASLADPPVTFGTGTYVIDPTGARRGPFIDADSGHPVLVSPFHREAALCGTCHDVSNPAFEKDGLGNYVPNAFDQSATDFSSDNLMAVERTYSEWFHSEYNTPMGVYAPQFGGNQDYVATCQDCHMRDVTGEACNFGTPPTRTDLPLHDFTGGSTWLPGLLSTLYPGEVDDVAMQAGIARARYMLQNAATLDVVQSGTSLEVTITNETGHKLPTGYPEGRRMWISVQFYDQGMLLLSESGAYDPNTGVLTHDPEVKIYETKPGLDSVTAPLVGVSEGPSFHFVLNNKIFKDNRIPPRGFTNAAFDDFGGAPVGISYPDGQYWDVTTYTLPEWADSADVSLLYQSTSKEFIEFLRDENTTDTKGQEMYDLWNDNGKCPPEVMQSATLALDPPGGCSSDSECVDADVCTADVCDWLTGCTNDPIPGCADTDGDGLEDAADNCPTIANGPAEDNQSDVDGDLVGDACDSCVNTPNPWASYPADRTTTGEQLDDDADGYGNLCDAKFTDGPVVTALDTIQYKTAVSKPVTASSCGTSGTDPCDRFDLDGTSPVITALDTIAYKGMISLPPGPKCAACGVDLVALPCVGDACP